MINDLLKYLPHILPTRNSTDTDKALEITANYFKLKYGDLVLSLLWHVGALPQSAKYVKKICLKDVIEQVTVFIKKYNDSDSFVWVQNGTLKIMSTKKIKKNGMRIYSQQKSEGDINPYNFMVEAISEPGFNDNCIISMAFQSLLILFDKLASQIRTIEPNNNFNLNASRLFHIVDATTQADKFCRAFICRQRYVKGANKSANLIKESKKIVEQAVKNLHISSNEALFDTTLTRVKQEFRNICGKEFNRSDRTLQRYIIEFAGH